jgi:hypothetical protein
MVAPVKLYTPQEASITLNSMMISGLYVLILRFQIL